MKRTFLYFMIILVFFSLVSCALIHKRTFNIRYEFDQNTVDDFLPSPTSAEPGSTVEIRTLVLIDADIHVYADGKEIEKTHYDSDYWGYTFIMPEHDVTITARFYTKDEIWGTSADQLREKYPEYFDLATFKGLEVYVWQTVPDTYLFGIMPGTNREKTDEELYPLKGASLEEMKAILSSYVIDPDEVFIIPFQHPDSSYISEYFIVSDDESEESVRNRRQAYTDRIRELLLDG